MIQLKPLTESERPIVERWLADATLMYYMISELNPSLPVLSVGIFSDEKLIGWANLSNIDYDNKKAEFGIAVPDHQPFVCYRATLEMLRIGFNELGLNRIYIRPLQSNLRDNDQRERFGFVKEGIERKSVRRGDKFEDVVIYSILKEEFEKRCL